MDTDVRLTLPKAGAFRENTVSKNEGSLGEKPNFGSKLGGIGWECYLWSFSERFKIRNLQKSSKMAKVICRIGGSLGESDRRVPISPKNVGSLGDSRDNQQKYGVIGRKQRWKYGVFGALHPRHLHNGSAPLRCSIDIIIWVESPTSY